MIHFVDDGCDVSLSVVVCSACACLLALFALCCWVCFAYCCVFVCLRGFSTMQSEEKHPKYQYDEGRRTKESHKNEPGN